MATNWKNICMGNRKWYKGEKEEELHVGNEHPVDKKKIQEN